MEKNGIIKRYLLLLLSLLFCMSGISDNTIKKELKRINGKLYICYNDSKHMSLVNEEIVTVKLKPQTTLDKGLIVVRSNRLGYIDLRVPRGMDVVDFEECLENSGLYEIVKYADIAETCLTPNDSYITNQWYLSTINMFNAWNISTGSSSIKVAVLDREVDWSHEDLGYSIPQAMMSVNDSGFDEYAHESLYDYDGVLFTVGFTQMDSNGNVSGGHGWVIDGFNDPFYHCNWGLNGTYDGLYQKSLFKPNNYQHYQYKVYVAQIMKYPDEWYE